MWVCPQCAEDVPEDADKCASCRAPLPAWVTRLPLTEPRAQPAADTIGRTLLVVAWVGLIASTFVVVGCWTLPRP